MSPQPPKPRNPILLVALALLIAAPSLWFGAGIYFRGEQVDGEVVDLSFTQTVNKGCSPTVAYEVDGQAHRWTSDITTAPCEFEVGDAVTLYYWPDAPADPYLPSMARLVLWPGLPLLIASILVWVAVRRPPGPGSRPRETA